MQPVEDRRNVAIINACRLSPFASAPLPDGTTALERTLSFAAALPSVREIRLIVESDSPPGYPVEPGGAVHGVAERRLMLGTDTASGLLDLFPTGEFDDIFYFHADAPLLDRSITADLYGRHVRYLAHYSFSDGYPYGLVPEIIASEVVPKLRSLAESVEGAIARDTLFSVIQKDINAFDIETDLSPKDQRLLRVSLTSDTKRNHEILGRVVASGGSDATSVTKILDEHPEILRSVPAYVQIQIVDGCPQACSYCPFPLQGGDVLMRRNEMSPDRFTHIIDETERFCDDAVVAVSAWGEPALHSRISEIVDIALAKPRIRVLIETSGVGWKPGVLESIVAKAPDRLTWIVSLDAIDPALYRKLRGTGFTEAMSVTERLFELSPANTWVQSVRMQENEEALEAFYRHWKERTDHLIIQKYSRFGETLPERKVTDLAPLVRFPCHHLKRDLVVSIDGSVPVCLQDTSATKPLGNLFEEPLSTIWERGREWYELHLREEYPDLCRTCDEYYTYNY